MCCHDWGAQHGIGYIDAKAFNQDKHTIDIQKKIESNSKGFEFIKKCQKTKKI